MLPTSRCVRRAASAGALLILWPTVSRAISLDTADASWLGGTLHPMLEAPHLIALLLLGLAAPVLGGRAAWGVPAMFVSLLTFGGVLGEQGATTPRLDTIILTTALCLVLLVLGRVPLVFATIASSLGAFALFHGVTDGHLMRVSYADFPYVVTYVAGNALVLAATLAIGAWIHRTHAVWVEPLRHWWHRHHLPFSG